VDAGSAKAWMCARCSALKNDALLARGTQRHARQDGTQDGMALKTGWHVRRDGTQDRMACKTGWHAGQDGTQDREARRTGWHTRRDGTQDRATRVSKSAHSRVMHRWHAGQGGPRTCSRSGDCSAFLRAHPCTRTHMVCACTWTSPLKHAPCSCAQDDELKSLALAVALKCADLGNLAAPIEVHRRWVAQLEEEYFQQVHTSGDTCMSQSKADALSHAKLMHGLMRS